LPAFFDRKLFSLRRRERKRS